MRRAALLGLAALLCSGAAQAATTLDRTIVPGPERAGYTPLTYGPGDARLVREDLAAARRGRARRRRSLVYFAQLSDFQLADEESPLRVESIDQSNSAFSAAWRPQEALMPHVIDAAVRQVNRHRRSPVRARRGRRARLAFTLLTGDNADNQQGNETGWVSRLLEGGPLDPNSGVVDDASMQGQGCAAANRAALAAEAPGYSGVQELATGTFYNPDAPAGQFAAFPRYPGLLDRAQKPFVATGLRRPSYVALGNHDGLVQGNQAATSEFTAIATGCLKVMSPALSATNLGQALSGLPDPGSTIIPPDPGRAPITKPQYRSRFGDRHGFQFIDRAEAEASRGPPATTPSRRARASASSPSTRSPTPASPARVPRATSTTRSSGGC